ncbi:(Fe-S)-binding protein [Vallitalea longa]|uniref:(Fe-S)-binding protein n=1 Tax=Vallitalea longa TaxID=2936439 RepID=A0A9W5YIH1_9FIRM|nr:epoxyqueuosine reductase [Vallitalea longa]GKX31903.1 (Fe-S)-binding protein [Vallitalea longa]
MKNEELSIYIENKIKGFTHMPNNYYPDSNEKIWGKPIIGYSRGDDPLYRFIKQDIGGFYWTPLDIFSLKYPNLKVGADELTVISWILPQTEYTKTQQRLERCFPAKNWVKSRIYGEEFNDLLRKYLVNILIEYGYESVAPAIYGGWNYKKSLKYGYASNWSERHVAFVSGLGTFGLCDGLITKVGKAMRCGSIVARIQLKPTLRPYTDYHEYCLYYKYGTCKKCINRCPAGAISVNGHDKIKCRKYQSQIITEHTKKEYNLMSSCCGLCQTQVPCESGIPIKSKG